MTELATRIADVNKKAEAATPGPWKQHLVDDTTVITSSGFEVCCTFPDGGTDDDKDFHAPVEQHEADGAYIAAASPDLILAMAAEIEALTAKLKRAERTLKLHEQAMRKSGAA